jgi:transposase
MSRRQYTTEFKKHAVELCDEPGRTIASVARDLGIPENNLQRWRKTNAPPITPKAHAAADLAAAQQRIKELERELTRIRTERDILKKTIAIFSQPKRDTP